MRKAWIFWAVWSAAVAALAYYEDVGLADGTIHTNVYVTRVEPDGLSFMHGQGVSKFYFHELSEEVQKRYSYDPVIAAVYWFYTQQARQDWEERQAEAARLESEERQKRLDAIEEEENALRNRGAAKPTNLKLLQIQEDGSWLCRTFQYRKGGFTTGKAKFTMVFDESQILVEGLPENLVDNDEWQGRIYEVGIQRLQTGRGPIRTLRKYKALP